VKQVEILYEDDFSIVVNKPAGLAVQGGKGIKTSLDMILAEIRDPAPLLVHRLDKDTSGVLLAAKGKEAAGRFAKVFGAERKALKQYIAVCAGVPGESEGIISEDLMVKNSLKKSQTMYKVIKTTEIEGQAYSVLEIELGTGRMHQIRRHLAMKGNPVLGDDKYGDFALNKKLKKTAGLKRLLLHAQRLVIKDVFNIDGSAPLPAYFSIFCA
jgi:23S rRNA pseudouridine955/2504/2580 synthase